MEHTVTEHKLQGGARLLTIQIPNTTTYYWMSSFRAGYRHVDPGMYELPHLAEHLAFEGTTAYPQALAFKSEVERDGTYYNATTSFDRVSYMYSGVRAGLARIIPINMSQIYEPLYEATRITQEQEVITQELKRRREDDGWRLWYLGMAALQPQRNLAIDTRIERIAGITRENLVQYHSDCYGVGNTDFVLAGDYTDAEIADVIKQVEEGTNGRSNGSRKGVELTSFVAPGGRVLAFEPFRKNQSLFQLRFALAGRDDDHYPALGIISTLLTGGLSAELMRKARESGLTYGIQSSAGSEFDISTLAIASQTDIEKLPGLVEMSLHELVRIGEGDFSDDQLARAVGFASGNLRRANQTPAQYASWYAGRFYDEMAPESPENLIAQTEAVDRAAIQTAFAKYVAHEHAILTLIGTDLPKKIEEYQATLRRYLA